MIPKIIHYCWFSKDKTKELPIAVQRSIESWKKVLPDYEIRLWNEETFDVNSTFWTKECYECGCASYAYLADYVRFWVLYNYGGIYLDADQMVTKPLDSFLDNKMFLGMMNQDEIGWCLIGAEKHNPVIKHLLDSYSKHYINNDCTLNCININYTASDSLKELYSISPNVNILQKLDGLTIYPKIYFYPTDEFHSTKDTYAIHLGLTSHYKMVSVVMPVYNGEKYLRECIDSVLAQTLTDFEFIIVDDGSTDNTESIIKSYTDDRIVYIKKNHDGISEALNLGIRRSIGLYIARMDADDMMYPNRLKVQVGFLENHKEYDAVGAGMEWGNGKAEKEYWQWEKDKEVKLEYFNQGNNCISHPTMVFRASTFKSLPIWYEKLYDGCEDYKLWHTMLTHGRRIFYLREVLYYYRQHSEQTTCGGVYNHPYNLVDGVIRAYNNKNSNDSKLTVIIPFQNEGIEVEKTVTSVRATAKNVNIMLINDNSNDGYDYRKVAEIFGCSYYNNTTNLGVAGSRNFGVFHCTTPYFVLLDAHMRFYEFDWDERLVNLLNENPNRLITSNTIYISKNEHGIYSNENGYVGRNSFGTYASFVNMTESGWEYTAKWTDKLLDQDPNAKVVPCSCVLGAVYASSTEWWFKIGGLTGLIKYGLDEPLMSIKTWLAGGEVLLIKNWGVGHLYRERGNYSVPTVQVNHNQLYLIHLFSPDDKIPVYEENLRKRIGNSAFNSAKALLMQNYSKLASFKKYFFTKVAKHDINYFLELNSKVSH